MGEAGHDTGGAGGKHQDEERPWSQRSFVPDSDLDSDVGRRTWRSCNTPPTKATLPRPFVGASTHTHSTLLTLSSLLRVKGLTQACYGWWTTAYKLAPPLLN
jgi:hypothetical protein